MKKLVNPSLSVGDIHTRRDTEAADEDIEIRTHFLPPFAGRAKPWNHAPTKAKTPPVRNPACQSSRKNAVATSATLSMAKRFDQYCNMMPPKHAFHPLPFQPSAFCCCRQANRAGEGGSVFDKTPCSPSLHAPPSERGGRPPQTQRGVSPVRGQQKRTRGGPVGFCRVR